MQPTFLPWSGYFDLIESVDHFVLLDNVQHSRQSWQTRNRILLNGAEHMLVVPTEKCALSTLISDVRINDARDWRRKHWLTLCAAYSNASYGHDALALLEPFYVGINERSLARFNQGIICAIADALSCRAKVHTASELETKSGRSERLVSICKVLECDTYVSPQGAKEYLEDDGFSETSGIRLEFQDYSPQPYRQFRSKDFVSHLSIVDVIANLGVERAKSYISDLS